MRAYGVHGLGEVGELSDPRVMATIADVLASDPNRFVRACAAEAVGCVARRAAAASPALFLQAVSLCLLPAVGFSRPNSNRCTRRATATP